MDIHRPLHPDTASQNSRYSPSLGRHFQVDAHVTAGEFDPRYNSLYDNAVRYVDERVNELIEWLQREGVWENTILIVTGDHGEALYDRGQYGHPRHYPYDELLHVPLLVRTPDEECARISHPMSLAWLGELLADVIDLPRPSFPAESERDSHIETSPRDSSLVVSDALDAHGHSVVVRDSKYKYITRKLSDSANTEVMYTPPDGGFHVLTDRGERQVLKAKEIPQPLRKEARNITTSPSELDHIEGSFSPTVTRRLEELGYKM